MANPWLAKSPASSASPLTGILFRPPPAPPDPPDPLSFPPLPPSGTPPSRRKKGSTHDVPVQTALKEPVKDLSTTTPLSLEALGDQKMKKPLLGKLLTRSRSADLVSVTVHEQLEQSSSVEKLPTADGHTVPEAGTNLPDGSNVIGTTTASSSEAANPPGSSFSGGSKNVSPPPLGKEDKLPQPPLSWAEKIKSSTDRTLRRHGPPSQPSEGNPRVLIPDEVFERGTEEHKDFVVGHFSGKTPSFRLTQSVLTHLWGKGKALEIHMSPASQTMLVRIPSDFIRKKVLEKKIWYIGTSMFQVTPWGSTPSDTNLILEAVPLWAHLKGVPLSLRTNEGLGIIAGEIGHPREMDEFTKKLVSLSEAHVQVIANLTRPLPSVVEVGRQDGSFFEVAVEYPWVPAVCSNCKVVGHLIRHCPKVTQFWAPTGRTLQRNKSKHQSHSEETVDASPVKEVIEKAQEEPLPKVNMDSSATPDPVLEDESCCLEPLPPDSPSSPFLSNCVLGLPANMYHFRSSRLTSAGGSVIRRFTSKRTNMQALGSSPKAKSQPAVVDSMSSGSICPGSTSLSCKGESQI